MKKLNMPEEEKKEYQASLNRANQKRYSQTVDEIKVRLPKGTMERIKALGYTGNAFAKEVILKELDRLEGK